MDAIVKPRAWPRYWVPTHDQRTGRSNGRLYSLWKHWESDRTMPPMELYVTTFEPNVLKGPHMHRTRWDAFTCIWGRVAIIVRDYEGIYHEFVSSDDDPITVEVPANMPSATLNLSAFTSIVTNLCNPAWHPDNEDNGCLEFEGYDFEALRRRLAL